MVLEAEVPYDSSASESSQLQHATISDFDVLNAIAEAGRREVLKNHTFNNRVETALREAANLRKGN